VGTRAVLDAVVKIKIPSPLRKSNSRTPIVRLQPSAVPTELSWLLNIVMYNKIVPNVNNKKNDGFQRMSSHHQNIFLNKTPE
jgi:hypothetical protein